MIHKDIKEKQATKDHLVEGIEYEEDEDGEDNDSNDHSEVVNIVKRERSISQQQRNKTKTSLSKLTTARREINKK